MTTRAPRSHPLASRGIRLVLWIIVTALVGVQSFGVWGMCVQDRQLCDFGHFYYAAAEWRNGDAGLYERNLASPRVVDGQQFELRNVASPVWHLVVLPFTFLSPGLAFALWVACNIAAWTWSLLICRSQWKLHVDHRAYPFIALGILSSTLTAGAFHTGQYVGLMMLPATLAWRAARENRWVAAGAWLGLLAYNKPFALIFVAWLVWNRQGRALVTTAIVLIGSVVLGELAFGPGIHQQWRASLQQDVTGWTWLYVNASAWAPWARAFRPSPSFAHVLEPTLAVLPALVSAGLVALVTGWRLRRPVDVDAAWAILWAAALLISPLGWTYYVWWAAGPFGVIVLRCWREQPHRRWQLLAIAACFWLPLNALTIGQPSVLASFFLGSLFTWAMIAFWLVALRDANHQNNRLATPVTQAAAAPAFPCNADALV